MVATDPASPADAPIDVDQLVSYAVEMWFADAEVLTDLPRLVSVLQSASAAGRAHVLGELTHVFPNGAVTAALVLSQSHLTIHTWPEFNLANIDLLSYGLVNGHAIIDHIRSELQPSRVNVSRLIRDVR